MTLSATHRETMVQYLDAFTAGNLNAILALFAEGALVHSPTQEKPKQPQDFYPALLERAKGTVFRLKSAFAGEKPGTAAVLFDYRKPIHGGGMHVFDCVDIFAFDAAGKIKEMWIIFDTKNLSKS